MFGWVVTNNFWQTVGAVIFCVGCSATLCGLIVLFKSDAMWNKQGGDGY